MSSKVPRRFRKQRGYRNYKDLLPIERQAIEAVREKFGNPVVFFGSRSRGNYADDSDIDLGVTGYSYKTYKQFKEQLTKELGIKVDLFRIEVARTHSSARYI